jgi:hypothetical protein
MTYVTFVLLGYEIGAGRGTCRPLVSTASPLVQYSGHDNEILSDVAHGLPAAAQPVVGQRVVVRSLVAGERGPSGGPAMTDVIGVLVLADEREVAVRRRDGTLRHVARTDIVAIKAVPPPPPPRSRARSSG